MRSWKCSKCPAVVHGTRLLCVDCERKGKIHNQARQCQFPLCAARYFGEGKQKYCIEHKGMTSREREAAIKAMRQQGLYQTD